MADELDPVTQEFEAITAEYETALDEASATAQQFADANLEAKGAVDGLRDSSAEAAGALEGVGLSADETRDRLAEVAAAAGLYRDELGKLRDSQGKFFGESALMDMALGHTRDEALEAAAAMKELKKEQDSTARDGLLAKLFSQGGGIPDSVGPLPLASLLAIVPAILAALPLISGVVSGFAAAGAGAVAFGVLAMPAIKAVSGAYTQITADQTAYNRATTAAAKSTALAHLKADYAALDPYERQALTGVQTLVGEYHKLSKAFEPQAFKIFDDVLKIANELLPDITPFATTFASAVGGLLTHLGSFAGSKGFKDWLQQFHGLEGPSVTAIGNGIGNVAVQIGHLLTVMSSKDVVNAINIAFGILAGTISVLTGMVWRLMSNYDVLSSAFRRVRHDVAADAHELAHVFDDLRHDIANDAHNIASYFDEIRHDIATFAHDVAAHFDEARHDIAQWAGDARHDVDLVISFFEGLPGKFRTWFDEIRSAIATKFGQVETYVKGIPGRILTDLGNLGNLLWSAGGQIIHGLITGIENAVPGLHTALSWVSSLIPSWKGPIEKDAQMLVPHGQVIMQGLMRGISSQLPALRSLLAGVTGVIPASIGAHGAGAVGSVGAAAAIGGASNATVHVTANFNAGTQGLNDPRFLQYLQTQIQEATLRYQLSNPSNGLSFTTGRR